MVGVISQFPQVGANFMGAYRDARQARLAEAAARAQMAAAQAERERQAQARASFNRLVNPPAPVTFDTGLNLPGAELPVAAEAGGMSFDTGLRARGPQGAPVAAAVSRYTPEQQNRDLANVFMGGMGQDLAAYRNFMNPGPAEIPEQAANFAQITAGRIQSGNMEPEQALTFGYRGAQQYGYQGSLQDFAGLVQAYGPEQQNRQPTALEIRAQEAGLQPGTPEYQQFMLRGGQGYAPRQPSSIDTLAANVGRLAEAQYAGAGPNANDYPPGEILNARDIGLPGAGPNDRVQVERTRYSNVFRELDVNEGAAEEAIRLLRSGEVQGTRNVAGVTYMTPEAVVQAGYPEGTVVRVETDAQGNIEDVVTVEAQSPEDRRRYENLLRNQAQRDREVLYSTGQSLLNINNLSTGVMLEVSRAFTSGEEPLAGTPAADLYASLMQLRANLGFEALQNIRGASPTGGALGPVSDTENRLLQNAMAAVMQSQSAGQLRTNLVRLARLRAESLNRRASILREESPEIYRSLYGNFQDDWPTVGDMRSGQRNMTYVYVGGDPADRRNWEALIPGS